MGKKILLADDSITIQKVIELTFSDEDFDVITVGNGRLALEKLSEVRPDIVLCDIIMPEKDGYEVCEQIKTNPAHSHVPVLLLTGAFEPFDQERAARAGYDGSLAKPFEPETLIAKVKDLLARAPVRASTPPPPAARPAPATPPVVTGGFPPAVSPPAVLPFQRPAAPAPAAAAAAAPPSFIPDEPFGGLEDSAFAEPAAPAAASADAFAPMTEEESATLLAPPAAEPSPADAASTVMFRAGDLPWNVEAAPPPPQPPPPPPTGAAPAGAAPAGATRREPEPLFVPEPVEAAEVVEEPPAFEEVLEEDLDFGTQGFEPTPPVESTGDESGAILEPIEVATLPPLAPEDEGGVTGAFEPVPEMEPEPVVVSEPAVPAKPTKALEREPEPVFEVAQSPFEREPEPVFEVARSPFEREPEPVFEVTGSPFVREPEPVFEETTSTFEPEPAPTFEPEAQAGHIERPSRVPAAAVDGPPPKPETPPVAPESFADVAAAVVAPPPAAAPPSEAAAVPVPVEMVEKIAQRVVAQISEKAVREIAWEIIPDLAEALIKQEIERLKAELQKT
jgi:CheY-like chemotaxis protein